MEEEMLGEKCGVFGCITNGDWPTNLDCAHIICLGLIGLQHRGQEAAGIVTCKYATEPFSVHRGMGLVSQIFNEPIMLSLKGNLGIGHTRYSTMGGADSVSLAQPFVVHTSYGTIAVAHNGELVNSAPLRQKILENGVGLSTGSDSELITQCLSMPPPDQFKKEPVSIVITDEDVGSNGELNNKGINNLNNGVNGTKRKAKKKNSLLNDVERSEEEILSRLKHFVSLTPLSYSLIVMYNECLYALRDPFGNRPLSLGMLVPPTDRNTRVSKDIQRAEGWVVSSESCSFPSICATLFRDVEPGEIVKLERNKEPKSLCIIPRPANHDYPAFCIFEYVYFAKADSIIESQMVYSVRVSCGRQLAREAPIVYDPSKEYIVSPVPESSNPAALGFALESGVPFVEVFCKNRYVGRTFIQPSTRLRRLGVAKKFGPLVENFKGKSIILIDDSIVRGTTIGQLVRLLKDAGADDVHIRIASPPLHYPCYMGINIPTAEELIANHLNAEQLANSLGAASLKYLSVEGLKLSVQRGIRERQQSTNVNKPIGHCVACLTGEYPVALDF
ncbi:amidophosphoribosyltransferase [Tetranychus urticae]|uniref:Amidophosphoribosyltransferase n=1 Tax=Tetranychus urticae TaxID=32264 RepID=T1JTD5_TETUR|nr:amidophosphoribosyltransferase [Tetranychus urticae]